MKAKITSWIEGLSQRKGKNLFLTFALIMFSVFSAIAQQTVTGTVTSKEGPIAGASVTVKGTNKEPLRILGDNSPFQMFLQTVFW